MMAIEFRFICKNEKCEGKKEEPNGHYFKTTEEKAACPKCQGEAEEIGRAFKMSS